MTKSDTQPPEAPWRLEEVPCDFCLSAEADRVLSSKEWLHGLPGEFQVVVCRKCGLARTSPRPTLDTLAAAYPGSYQAYRLPERAKRPPRGLRRWALVNYRDYPLGRKAPAALRAVMRPMAAMALSHREAVGYFPYVGQGRLLDFGCGGGKYVAQMAAAGWKAEGLDLSPDAVREAAATGLTVHQGTLPGADLPKAAYDLVTLWHAIEHVPSPKATLAAVREILRPGGRLAVICPRFDSLPAKWYGDLWYGLDLPRHLTHFTRDTLVRHVTAAGFVVERTASIRRPALVRQSLIRRAEVTRCAWHRLLARSRLVPRLLSHLVYLAHSTDEVLLVARRAD